MPKTASHIHKTAAGDFEIHRTLSGGRRSAADELAILKKHAEYLKANKDEARKVLVRAGIYTKTGKLTKAFGG